jgi:hypothetical protein
VFPCPVHIRFMAWPLMLPAIATGRVALVSALRQGLARFVDLIGRVGACWHTMGVPMHIRCAVLRGRFWTCEFWPPPRLLQYCLRYTRCLSVPSISCLLRRL